DPVDLAVDLLVEALVNLSGHRQHVDADRLVGVTRVADSEGSLRSGDDIEGNGLRSLRRPHHWLPCDPAWLARLPDRRPCKSRDRAEHRLGDQRWFLCGAASDEERADHHKDERTASAEER